MMILFYLWKTENWLLYTENNFKKFYLVDFFHNYYFNLHLILKKIYKYSNGNNSEKFFYCFVILSDSFSCYWLLIYIIMKYWSKQQKLCSHLTLTSSNFDLSSWFQAAKAKTHHLISQTTSLHHERLVVSQFDKYLLYWRDNYFSSFNFS